MNWKEMEHLDFNPLFIGIALWWDGLMWWVRELQIAHNKLHQGDSGE